MDLATFLVQCLNALQYGLLLFLVASGLTLIFGIMGVINLAHGSFYMIGAYMAFSLAPLFGGNFFVTLAAGLVQQSRLHRSLRYRAEPTAAARPGSGWRPAAMLTHSHALVPEIAPNPKQEDRCAS